MNPGKRTQNRATTTATTQQILVATEIAPLIDQPARLRLEGLRKGQRVKLNAASTDSRGFVYQSWAEFEAGAGGIIDPARQSARAGTYEGRDPFGLWWSMAANPDRSFTRDLSPVPTAVSAEINGEIFTEIKFDRLRVRSDVSIEHVSEVGLVGTLFLPASTPAPGVIVLGGSEGGIAHASEMAAVLASHSFAALALAYFGMNNLPRHLLEIPLEYVESAVLWLLAHPKVCGDGIGAIGASRGGELALLLASVCPQVRAVIGFAASSIVWPGYTPGSARLHPAWMRGGIPFPFAVPAHEASSRLNTLQPLVLRESFEKAIQDLSQVEKAVIPTEKIQGPLLLISGEDDRMWPSCLLGEMAMARRAAARRSDCDMHLTYARAGHAIGRLPGLPAAPTVVEDSRAGLSYDLGGEKAGNARSAAHAWPRVLAFLSDSLTTTRLGSSSE
jgi:dienelactone hydrolase